MNRNSFAALPFLLAKLILCASDGDSLKLITPRPFNSKELAIYREGFVRGNHSGYDLGFVRGNHSGYDLGFVRGNHSGYDLGYEEGNSKNILAHFDCAINSLKPLLEVYKEPKTKNLWKGREKDVTFYKTKFKLPNDIEEIIEKNDEWVPLYERKLRGNGDQEDIVPFLDLFPETEMDYGTHPFEMEITKSFTKLRATTTFSPSKAMVELKLQIRKSAYNWYYIISCKEACPSYVVRLQSMIRQIQAKHPDVYKTVTDAYFKFAAHTARSYKLLCAVHHKFMDALREHSSQNKDATFSQALFSCAPSWSMTYEQVLFLNTLRDAIYPGRYEPLKYYVAKNSKNDDTLIIYDDSNCPGDPLKQMTKSIVHTYEHDFCTTPNIIETPATSIPQRPRKPKLKKNLKSR